jgi:uncharacterized protein (DUF427 family)
MKIPGPDHPITITPNPKEVRIEIDGKVIARSKRALSLKESSYPAVQYIPREDVDQSVLLRTTNSTHCPYKGDASYWTIAVDAKTLENAVWSYEEPFPAMEQIRGYMAFYTNKVKVTEV